MFSKNLLFFEMKLLLFRTITIIITILELLLLKLKLFNKAMKILNCFINWILDLYKIHSKNKVL